MGLFDGIKKKVGDMMENNDRKTDIFNKALAGEEVSQDDRAFYAAQTSRELDSDVEKKLEQIATKKRKDEILAKVKSGEEVTDEEKHFYNSNSSGNLEVHLHAADKKDMKSIFKRTHNGVFIEIDTDNKIIKLDKGLMGSVYYSFEDLLKYEIHEGEAGQESVVTKNLFFGSTVNSKKIIDSMYLKLTFGGYKPKIETLKYHKGAKIKTTSLNYKLGKKNMESALRLVELVIADNEASLSNANNNSSSDNQSSNLDELKKLKELLDSGIVTQEEFDAKKQQILGL
ncbi:SHOCT domain-containing protein [Peptostreptococcaceae bacterium OttesenSCG-928-C18]|nr:SHOCT domain-containing protein [Peptostreptococcaceae bacterium OttesenSCG-928-C18]